MPSKLVLLVRSDYGLCLSVVESAAFSDETAKQRFATLSSNGRPTVGHVLPGSALQGTSSSCLGPRQRGRDQSCGTHERKALESLRAIAIGIEIARRNPRRSSSVKEMIPDDPRPQQRSPRSSMLKHGPDAREIDLPDGGGRPSIAVPTGRIRTGSISRRFALTRLAFPQEPRQSRPAGSAGSLCPQRGLRAG
jgi:hypothetical protein